MTGLLVVISVLLVMVILLIPEGTGDTAATVAGDNTGEPSGTAAEGVIDPPSDTREQAQPSDQRSEDSQPMPEEEGSGLEEQDEQPLPWWLPAPSPGITPGTVYVVLDDAGGSLEELERFLSVDYPLTIAILPQLAYSSESALAAVTAGHEIILHQPMEAIGGRDPGPGAILVGTPSTQIQSIVRENLATVPGAVGVNNHMGSRATQDPAVMTALLEMLQNHDLLFLDSRTSPDTVGAAVAEDTQVRFAERHVFLDNERQEEPILEAFGAGFLRASEGQDTIMIGHVTSEVLASLMGEVGEGALQAGYSFGYLSDAVGRSGQIAEEQRR